MNLQYNISLLYFTLRSQDLLLNTLRDVLPKFNNF